MRLLRFYAALVHGNDIRISFDQKATVLTDNCLFGEINAIKLTTLMIDFRFRRIDVLHLYVLVAALSTRPPKATTFPDKVCTGNITRPQKRSCSVPLSLR